MFIVCNASFGDVAFGERDGDGGGGVTSSTGFRARLSFGAPQPMGTTSSTRYRVTLGPGAGRN